MNGDREREKERDRKRERKITKEVRERRRDEGREGGDRQIVLRRLLTELAEVAEWHIFPINMK